MACLLHAGEQTHIWFGKATSWEGRERKERQRSSSNYFSSQQASSLRKTELGEEKIFNIKSNLEILGWTHLTSELKLYFQLKMTIDRPVYRPKGQ